MNLLRSSELTSERLAQKLDKHKLLQRLKELYIT